MYYRYLYVSYIYIYTRTYSVWLRIKNTVVAIPVARRDGVGIFYVVTALWSLVGSYNTHGLLWSIT